MIKRTIIIFIALFISLSSSAQVNLDSLWNRWNDKSQPDTMRLKAMKEIAWEGYLYSQPDSAFYYAGIQYELAMSVNNKKWSAIALNTQGTSLSIRGDYNSAIDYFSRSLKIYKEIGDKKGIASSLTNFGLIYDYQGKYDESLIYYKKV